MARALHRDLQVALARVGDCGDHVVDRGGKRDDRGTLVDGQVPRLAGVVPAHVVGEDELVGAGGVHAVVLLGKSVGREWFVPYARDGPISSSARPKSRRSAGRRRSRPRGGRRPRERPDQRPSFASISSSRRSTRAMPSRIARALAGPLRAVGAAPVVPADHAGRHGGGEERDEHDSHDHQHPAHDPSQTGRRRHVPVAHRGEGLDSPPHRDAERRVVLGVEDPHHDRAQERRREQHRADAEHDEPVTDDLRGAALDRVGLTF